MKAKEVINAFGKDKLNNAEHSEFHAWIHKYLKEATPEVFNCTEAELTEYAADQKAEEELIGRQSASLLTADVQESDEERDLLHSYIVSLTDTAAKCPMPAQKKAGQELQTIIKPFRGIGRIALAQESTEIRSLIEKLRAMPTQTAAIAGMDDAIDALETANNKVADLMSSRTGSAEAKAEALAKRATTDSSYDYIMQRIDATIVLHDTPEVQKLKTEINNLILRTQNMYNTRIGVKHANEDKDETTQN